MIYVVLWVAGLWADDVRLRAYVEGQGDVVNRFIRGISRVTVWFIGVITLLTKSP